MLQKPQKRKSEGFTIIEVLIVLAIAGLIMVMVFIAVPNLQRSQRNAGRRQDASQILSAANNQVANANGTMPTDPTTFFDTTSMSQFNGLTASSAKTTLTAGFVGLKDLTTGTLGAQTVPTTNDAVLVVTDASCTGVNNATYKNRGIAVIYTQETSGGYTLACINS